MAPSKCECRRIAPELRYSDMCDYCAERFGFDRVTAFDDDVNPERDEALLKRNQWLSLNGLPVPTAEQQEEEEEIKVEEISSDGEDETDKMIDRNGVPINHDKGFNVKKNRGKLSKALKVQIDRFDKARVRAAALKTRKCNNAMERKLRMAVRRRGSAFKSCWRLKLQNDLIGLPVNRSEMAIFSLIPPKNSVAHKNQWACESILWNYRDQFIVNVPDWFIDRQEEAEKEWKDKKHL